MAQPDPFVALLTAIKDAQAAGGGTANTFVPGAQGISAPGAVPGQDAGGTPASVGLGGGASVPGTATTGPGLLEDVIAGTSFPSDPLTGGATFQNAREPGERGDLGAGVTGGDVNTLLSVMGGPLSIASILGSLVASNELGLPPATSLNSLISGQGDSFADSRDIGREIGGNLGGPAVTGTIGTGAGNVNSIRSGSFNRERSDRPDRGSGRSPSRGDVSNAGR